MTSAHIARLLEAGALAAITLFVLCACKSTDNTDIVLQTVAPKSSSQPTATGYWVSAGEAENDYEYAVSSNNTAEITKYLGTATEVIIPEQLGELPVTGISKLAFVNCDKVVSVIMPNTITSIGSRAFGNCTSLRSITLSTTLLTIGDNAFTNCSALTAINVPQSVTSIGFSAFWQCSALSQVTLPSSSTVITQGMFALCTALTSVTLPDGVSEINEKAFWSCSQLTEITIPASLTMLGNDVFSDCTKLKTIYFRGTEQQWTTLNAVINNSILKNVTVLYDS